jgi:hypothetical protein
MHCDRLPEQRDRLLLLSHDWYSALSPAALRQKQEIDATDSSIGHARDVGAGSSHF